MIHGDEWYKLELPRPQAFLIELPGVDSLYPPGLLFVLEMYFYSIF